MPVRNEADPRWDSLKSTIEALYLKNRLEGEKGVMETMARDHEFSKSKSQYESHFKIWGTRKYRRKDEWKSIGRNIAERKRAGKESNVYFNGDMILDSKVQKETRRHGFVTALEQNRPAPIPPIPDGFEIRTPIRTTAAEDIVPLPTLPGETPSFPIGTETPILASSQLQTVSSALPSQTVISDASLNVLRNAMSPSTPRITTDLSPIQSQNAILPYAPEIYGSPISLFDDDDKYLRRLSSFFILPFCQLKEDLLAQVEPSLISKPTQRSGFDLTLGTSLLPEHTHDVSHRGVDILHKMLKDPETLAAVFKTLLPSEDDQMILRSTYSHSDSASSKIFSLLIFAMANNFAGLNSVPIEEIADFLNRHASIQLLQQILSTSGPESEAFAEKLFQAAILMEEARIVQVLLQKGLVPDDLICVHRGSKYTPLEYSCMAWSIEITRLLLDAKSDVNKSIECEEDSGGAILRALTGPWWHKDAPRGPIPSELVHMLLEAGGKVSWDVLRILRSQDNQELFELLLDHPMKTETSGGAWYILISEIVNEWDNATAIRTVTKILKAGPTMHDSVDLTTLYNIMDAAAERGSLELVQLFLGFGWSLERKTLTCAIRSRKKELIRFILDFGAAILGFATKDEYDFAGSPTRVASPLSEAIRWGDPEILLLLEEKGAWSRIVNKTTSPGEFEDVLVAASVQGQLTTVQELLKYREPNTHGDDLQDALVAAIYVNEEAIVLTLLDAGANVNEGLYFASDMDTAVKESFDSASSIHAGTYEDFRESSYKSSRRGPALVEALLQRNERLVQLILDADVCFGGGSSGIGGEQSSPTPLEAAVEWGNLSIIEQLISMDIPMPPAAVLLSIKKGDTKCTQLLVEAGADTSSALIFAVTNNDIELIEYLFSVGADSANSKALLEAEALPDWLPMMERLLTEFARTYPRGRFGYGCDTFLRAIRKENFALVKILLEAKIDVNSGHEIEPSWDLFGYNLDPSRGDFEDGEYSSQYRTKTLLGEAITQRYTTSLAILESLLNEIRNPNVVVQKIRASSGLPYDVNQTALLVAIDTKNIHKVQLLIDAGANLNWPARNRIKRTPVQKAAEIGSYEITQLLINQGGLVNNEPAVRGGATALQLAAIGGYIGIAQLLLENDADVNAPAAKFYGRTALEGAAEHGRIDMLKLLCNAGAEFKGTEYETARELAKKNGHMATWRYLETLYPSSEMASMDN